MFDKDAKPSVSLSFPGGSGVNPFKEMVSTGLAVFAQAEPSQPLEVVPLWGQQICSKTESCLTCQVLLLILYGLLSLKWSEH